MALDHTKFYIRFYRTDTNKILVELQRAEGDSFNFIKYVQAILAAARGEAFDESNIARRRSSLSFIPGSLLQCHEHDEDRRDVYLTQIENVEELLRQDRVDAVLLGFESLLVMTDQERSHDSASAAKTVLLGSHSTYIKDLIGRCIHCPRFEFDYEYRQSEIIHTSALAILANSLQTAHDATCTDKLLNSLVQNEEWMGHDGIINALLSELAHAEDSSHEAYHAARCLNVLLDFQIMKTTLIDRGLLDAVKVSQTVGHRRHSLLAKQCDSAMALMADA